MKVQVSILLLIVSLSVITATFVAETQVSYAQGSSGGIGASASHPSATQPSQIPLDYIKLTAALLGYLILSVVLESALTVVFNWRLFIRHFEKRGWKTPVVISFAAFIVWNYDLDVMRDVLNALGMTDCQKGICSQWATSTVGRVVTTFLLAGGSAAILRIFTYLGIRSPLERKEKAAEEAAA
jgi:hypothetical protein